MNIGSDVIFTIDGIDKNGTIAWMLGENVWVKDESGNTFQLKTSDIKTV